MFLEWQRPKTRHPLHFIFLIYGKPGLESRPSQILSDTCSGFCPLSYNERLEHTLLIEMLFLLTEQQTFHIPRVPCNFQQTELQHLSHRRWVHNSRYLPALHFWFRGCSVCILSLSLPAATPKTHTSYLSTSPFPGQIARSVCWQSFQGYVLFPGHAKKPAAALDPGRFFFLLRNDLGSLDN